MSFADTLITIFEFLLVIATVWAVFHEGVFIAFEEKILTGIRRRRFRVIRTKSVVGTKSYSKGSKVAIR